MRWWYRFGQPWSLDSNSLVSSNQFLDHLQPPAQPPAVSLQCRRPHRKSQHKTASLWTVRWMRTAERIHFRLRVQGFECLRGTWPAAAVGQQTVCCRSLRWCPTTSALCRRSDTTRTWTPQTRCPALYGRDSPAVAPRRLERGITCRHYFDPSTSSCSDLSPRISTLSCNFAESFGDWNCCRSEALVTRQRNFYRYIFNWTEILEVARSNFKEKTSFIRS